MNYVQRVRSSGRKRTLVSRYFIPFSVTLGVMFVSISQFDTVTADQSYSEFSVKMISSGTMSGMQGMSGMSNNMSGMQGMSGMSNNMSGMQGMSGMLGISSNEEVTIFLEWMFVLAVILVGVPFAWVFISEKRKKSNRTNTAPKSDSDKI